MTPRWPTVALLCALSGCLVFVYLRVKGSTADKPEPVASTAPTASAAANTTPPDAGAPEPPRVLSEIELIAEGKLAPPLPASAPESVRFGGILLAYSGAQYVGAEARPRAEAKALAESMIETARTDFEQAVKRGDPGSVADAGVMPRGVLEPHFEYLLFTLPRKTVLEHPVDTPRGFLIVKRL